MHHPLFLEDCLTFDGLAQQAFDEQDSNLQRISNSLDAKETSTGCQTHGFKANHISGCALEVLVLRPTAEVPKQCRQEVVEVEAGADGSPSKRDAGPEAPAHTPLSWVVDRPDGVTSSRVGRSAKAFLKKILCVPC